jgi:hypothetical protein
MSDLGKNNVPRLAEQAAAHMARKGERELAGQREVVRAQARRVELLCAGLTRDIEDGVDGRGLFALRGRLQELDAELGVLIRLECEAEGENLERAA